MEKFKPRKSVKRFVCETLVSTLISSLILTLIVVFYNQENLGISVVVLILFYSGCTFLHVWRSKGVSDR